MTNLRPVDCVGVDVAILVVLVIVFFDKWAGEVKRLRLEFDKKEMTLFFMGSLRTQDRGSLDAYD